MKVNVNNPMPLRALVEQLQEILLNNPEAVVKTEVVLDDDYEPTVSMEIL